MSDEVWTAEELRNMPMSEYLEHRKHIFGQLSDLTLEELQQMDTIPKPPKPFHFEGF